MKRIAILTMLMTTGLLCQVTAPAQKIELTKPFGCPIKSYPANAEEFVANYVNELVNKNLADDPVIVAEAAKLKTPKGRKQVKEYLKSRIEIGANDAENTYHLCSFLKEIALDLGEEDEGILKQKLMQVTAEQPKRTHKCLPFLCIFRLCKC